MSSYLVIAAVLGECEAGAECPGPMLAAGPGDSCLISPNKFRGEARVVTSQLQAVPAVRQAPGGGDIQCPSRPRSTGFIERSLQMVAGARPGRGLRWGQGPASTGRR